MAHTHSVTAAGTVGNHTLTVAEMPAHEHPMYYTWSGAGNVGGNWKINMTNTANGGSGTWPHTSGLSGNPARQGGGGAHNHGFTGSAVTSGGASNANTGESTPTTSAASNETSGSASTLPPYLVVYMWKRTA